MYSEVKEQFKKVIEFSQNIHKPDVDDLFEKWLEAKRDIIEAFGGKLIVELPQTMHFRLDAQDRKKYFDEFVYDIDRVYHNDSLVRFLTENKDGFYDNIVQNTYEVDDIKVPKGMKIVKAFKYFEKNERLLEQFQIKASQIIQEDKIEGTLCLSVHPLDFLSTSMNTYNWRSCHALDGEYRAGNLSYMVDKSTIVCYLKGADNIQIPLFPIDVPWNSKKWRVLMYLSDNWDMIFASRQYPFSSKIGLDVTLTYLKEALKLSGDRYTPWKDIYIDKYKDERSEDIYLYDKYIPMKRRLYPINEIVDDGKGSQQFNDLLRSSTYNHPYYSIKDDWWWFEESDIPHFTIGGEVKCLCCGGETIKDPDIMVCRHCAEEYGFFEDEDSCVCDCCGGRIYDGEWVEVEGEVICTNCFERECFVCDRCGEPHFNDGEHYDRTHDQYICTRCYERLLERGEL